MQQTRMEAAAPVARPEYVKPSVRVLTEEEILNSFQVTQAMSTWWVNTSLLPCTC